MELTRRTVSLRDAQKMYGCSKTHFIRQIHAGKLRGQKVGEKWFLDAESLDCLFLGKCSNKDDAA